MATLRLPVSVRRLLNESKKRGYEARKVAGPNPPVKIDCITLVYRTKTGGHVLVVPKPVDFSGRKVSKSVVRRLIGARDVDKAFKASTPHLGGLKSGELTPFLGRHGNDHAFYFDQNTVDRNPLVRFYHSKRRHVLMRYGDAYRAIAALHPGRVSLEDLFPSGT
ncbi:MAG TPA: hypothetical protein VI874_00385 [Candidatus Norongarragalinales archaeon]|nr:hypothetical protein [Candidatus Norongarragalinales archaeon]